MITQIYNCVSKHLSKFTFRRPWKNKIALVSYVGTIPFYSKKYFSTSHNAKIYAYQICLELHRRGYSVELRSYNDTNININKKYSIFIGHTSSFRTIFNLINLDGPAILLTTGSSPEFGNKSQLYRALNLQKRKGTFLKLCEENLVANAKPSHEVADSILVMGNEFVKKTWYPEHQHKYHLINNVTTHTPDFCQKGKHGNYLYLSSTGQVHRGLDLLLEAFTGRNEKLYICSSFMKELNFLDLYKKELFYSPNINAVGFIDLTSKKFNNIVQDCGFVILPSCSEGQSSSVINACFKGLIPIVTENTGMPDIDQVGYLIKEPTPSEIIRILDTIKNSSEDDYTNKLKKLKKYINQFTIKEHTKALELFFNKAGI